MTTTKSSQAAPAHYGRERVDQLPFNTPAKSARYATGRFAGATGLNWFNSDPSLQFITRFYTSDEAYAWAAPRLAELGSLIGTSISEKAEVTDRNPPYLVKYDKWGHDISEVVVPESVASARRDLLDCNFSAPEVKADADRRGISLKIPNAAYSYLLCQADIGLSCAMGTGGNMVEDLVNRFAPPDVRDWLMPRIEAGELRGSTAQSLTERTGGSDLGAMETTATPQPDGSYLLNGFKWFVSNADGFAFVVLAKAEGAPDSVKGVENFLVLRERRDGSRNGVRIRRLKDKLGTKAVASAEVEFVDAEAFILSSQGGTGDGKGLSRMMELTNSSRLGVAIMGIGCARRALVESICYARSREAWGRPLIEQPLMRRKLAELIVDIEGAQALVFDGYGVPNRLRESEEYAPPRIGAPLAKLKAARLGISAASDAVEIHGGNGYIEDWPVARIYRDAQVNPVWEGPDNILCLDVRRGIERARADAELIERLREAVRNSGEGDATSSLVSARVDALEDAIERWKQLDRETGEARLYALSQAMAETYAAALLLEQAAWERQEYGTDRKALVARLYVRRYLARPDLLDDATDPADEAIDRFDDLLAGVLVDDRVS